MKTGLIKLLVISLLAMVPMSAFSTGHSFDLKFAKGKSSTVVDTAVVRGDRDYYHFGASAGQRLSAALTSLEDNAVMVIFYRKNAKWTEITGTRDARVWYGKLPKSESGKYRIEVGGTRGNASYQLFVGISVVAY